MNVGLPAAGTVQLVSATPIERVRALTSTPSSAHVFRSMPFSAAAPTIFSTTSVPATPRRPALWVDFSTATSSLVTTVAAGRSSNSAAISKFYAVAGVVLYDEEHTGVAADRGRCLDDLAGGRRGKDLSGACGVEHSGADESDVQRVVTAAASGDQRDFFGGRRAPKHEFALRPGARRSRRGRRRNRRDFSARMVSTELMNFFMPASP